MKTEMRDIDIIRMAIGQIGGLRIPVSEEYTAQSLAEILHNLQALEEAMAERDRKAADAAAQAEPAGTEADEDV